MYLCIYKGHRGAVRARLNVITMVVCSVMRPFHLVFFKKYLLFIINETQNFLITMGNCGFPSNVYSRSRPRSN